MARGFLISDGLHKDIKRTIARVDGMPDGPGATKIPTRFEGSPAATPEKNTITVKIHQNWPTLDHTPLAAGQGIAVPYYSGSPITKLQTAVKTEDLDGMSLDLQLAKSESAIPAFSKSATTILMEEYDLSVLGGSRCGVITSVAKEVDDDGYWECVVQVRGIVKCRVLMLQSGNSLVPPPPYPSHATLRPFWRRYLTVSTYGYSTLLGVGAYRSLQSPGTTQYPAVAEAAVLLG